MFLKCFIYSTCFIVLIIVAVDGFNRKLIYQPNKNSTSIVSATATIISDFYSKVSTTVSITRSSINDQNYLSQSELIDDVVSMTESIIVTTIEDNTSINDNYYVRVFNIMFIDSYEAFR